MNKLIEKQTFSEERSLYNLTDATVKNCIFSGEIEGESAMKESRNIEVIDCSFTMRYPLWHSKNYVLNNCRADERTRAALWYAENGKIIDSKLYGVKMLRECRNTEITDCEIVSPEFGWRCENLKIINSAIESEYFLFQTKEIFIDNLKLKGKYSFQYVENLRIEKSVFDTKDAFWHAKNVYVKDTFIKGEYLGWYSDGLTLENCTIEGTQPLCYCKNLKLINCKTQNCDLAFEYSDVTAEIIGHIDSVKNPKTGKITADTIGEIIKGQTVYDCNAEIKVKN